MKIYFNNNSSIQKSKSQKDTSLGKFSFRTNTVIVQNKKINASIQTNAINRVQNESSLDKPQDIYKQLKQFMQQQLQMYLSAYSKKFRQKIIQQAQQITKLRVLLNKNQQKIKFITSKRNSLSENPQRNDQNTYFEDKAKDIQQKIIVLFQHYQKAKSNNNLLIKKVNNIEQNTVKYFANKLNIILTSITYNNSDLLIQNKIKQSNCKILEFLKQSTLFQTDLDKKLHQIFANTKNLSRDLDFLRNNSVQSNPYDNTYLIQIQKLIVRLMNKVKEIQDKMQKNKVLNYSVKFDEQSMSSSVDFFRSSKYNSPKLFENSESKAVKFKNIIQSSKLRCPVQVKIDTTGCLKSLETNLYLLDDTNVPFRFSKQQINSLIHMGMIVLIS